MRIAEYKIVDYKIETITIPAQYDEEMNLISEERIEEIRKPIYDTVIRDMTEEEIAEMPTPSIDEVKQQLINTVQNHMDATAQTRDYDSIASVCSYGLSTVDKFRNEAVACIAWRDAVWSYCYAQLDLFEAGERDIPTDIIAELPKLEW